MAGSWCPPGYELLAPLRLDPEVETWRASSTAGDGDVVLKRWPRLGREATQRLRREAAVTGSLRHPHLAPIRDVLAAVDGSAVVVVDEAPGGSLTDVLAHRPRLAPPEVVTLLTPLAQALAALHARGCVHGAVTAGNVLFDATGRPMLAEAGVHAAVTGLGCRAADDVVALAALGRRALGDASPAHPLAAVLARAGDRSTAPTAADLARAVLESGPAAPIGLSRPAVPVAPPAAKRRPAPPPEAARRPAGRHRSERSGRRRPPVALARAATAVVLLALAVVGGVAWAGHDRPATAGLPALSTPAAVPVTSAAPARPARGPSAAPAPGIGDVAALERRRARAFRTADERLLATVYVPGSAAGHRDVATLRRLVRHGWVAVGLQPSVRRVVVLRRAPGRALLRVVDGMSAYDVVDGNGGIVERVPARPLRPLRMTLVRSPGGWRIRRVDVG